MEPNKSQPPMGPPPAYSETVGTAGFPADRNLPPYHQPPNFVSLTNPPSINSSVIPILPSAPEHAHNVGAIPNYGTVVIVNDDRRRQLLPAEQTGFICPVCNIGLLEKEFTLLGFLLAILLFPFGLICLFVLRKWKCSLCGSSMDY